MNKKGNTPSSQHDKPKSNPEKNRSNGCEDSQESSNQKDRNHQPGYRDYNEGDFEPVEGQNRGKTDFDEEDEGKNFGGSQLTEEGHQGTEALRKRNRGYKNSGDVKENKEEI